MKKMTPNRFEEMVNEFTEMYDFENVKIVKTYKALFSSNKHKGKVEVEWDEADRLFYIYIVGDGVEIVKMTEHGVGTVLYDFGNYFLRQK